MCLNEANERNNSMKRKKPYDSEMTKPMKRRSNYIHVTMRRMKKKKYMKRNEK